MAIQEINNEGVVIDGKTVPHKEFVEAKVTHVEVPATIDPTVESPEGKFGGTPTVMVEKPCKKEVAFNKEQLDLIKAKVAPNATNTEFQLLLYMAQKYQLDPLLRQIWLVKFGDSAAQIYAGRDGFLEIAHRSGHFDGMKSWCEYDEKGEKPTKAHCIVWRNDMSNPFETEVLFKEYTTGKNLWVSKPSVMIIKVAESMCLRKAFSVSGIFSPEEIAND